MTLIRISPDGKEVVNIFNEFIHKITSKHSDVEINRASEVFYCNNNKGWKIKMLWRGKMHGLLLPVMFKTRQEAIDYEIKFLEELLRQPNSYND